jgi:ketosteroid isomerase-like protein
MFVRPFVAAAVVFSLAAGSAQAGANPKDVAKAERAFAADGAAMGIKQSFLKHMADDAIVFAPDPVNAKQFYGAQSGQNEPRLVWWPTVAAISRSDDLGFTFGPYELDGKRGGHFFTVWKKQADGSWKWVYDGGQQNDASASPADGKLRTYPIGLPSVSWNAQESLKAGAYNADGATVDIEGLEKDLAQAAKQEDLVYAYDRYLGHDAIVMGSPNRPAMTEDEIEAELKTRPARINFKRLGGGVSQAGDLAWTYGDADWIKAGEKKRAHYVRVWQKRSSGWKIIFDELLEVRQPATPAG